MVEKIAKSEDCVGCMACLVICKSKAIVSFIDYHGFLKPVIDKQKCINCGKCNKVCPVINVVKTKEYKNAFAAWNINAKQVQLSSSGGIFFLLAKEVIKKEGTVYGAVMNDNNSIEHLRATSIDDVDKMRGSKYVQSNISRVFTQIYNDAANNKTVMVTGTPCQIASIQNYLRLEDKSGRVLSKILFVDLVCHGVGSPGIWGDYLKTKNKNINGINFKDKKKGWGVGCFSYRINGKTHIESHIHNKFMACYSYNYGIRECCFNCKYKGIERNSDITLGDYWGYKSIINDNISKDTNGISAILTHTNYGEEMINRLNSLKLAHIEETNLDDMIEGNPCIIRSCSENGDDSTFYKCMQSFLGINLAYVFVIYKVLRAKTIHIREKVLKSWRKVK